METAGITGVALLGIIGLGVYAFWPMNSNQTFFWNYGMFVCMLEVYYFIYSTLHGTKYVLALGDVAADNSDQLYFKSI